MIKYLLTLFFIIITTGCNLDRGISSEIIVKSIKSKQNFAVYSCILTYDGQLTDRSFTFADSIGKFNINDTLIICKKHNYEKTNN